MRPERGKIATIMANKLRCKSCGRLIGKNKPHSCQPPWNKGKKTGIIPKSAFKEGNIPWNCGKNQPDETKKKISETNKRKNISPPREYWFTIGHRPHNFGTVGLTQPNKTSFKQGNKPKHAGKKRPKISGKKHWNWRGGITARNMAIRNSLEYKIWRDAVYERDDFTCNRCKKRGGDLHAHHIKPFSQFPELRFDIDNGMTLCRPCHYEVHSTHPLQ